MTPETLKRLRHYVAERRKMRGLHLEVIHALHSPLDEDRHAELLLSDIEALLAALDASSGERPEIQVYDHEKGEGYAIPVPRRGGATS